MTCSSASNTKVVNEHARSADISSILETATMHGSLPSYPLTRWRVSNRYRRQWPHPAAPLHTSGVVVFVHDSMMGGKHHPAKKDLHTCEILILVFHYARARGERLSLMRDECPSSIYRDAGSDERKGIRVRSDILESEQTPVRQQRSHTKGKASKRYMNLHTRSESGPNWLPKFMQHRSVSPTIHHRIYRDYSSISLKGSFSVGVLFCRGHVMTKGFPRTTKVIRKQSSK